MNKINILYNVDSGNIEIDQTRIDKDSIKVYFCITGFKQPYNIENLSFGYEILSKESILDYDRFPYPGVRYKTTDQKIILSKVVTVEKNREYKINFWVKQNSNLQKREIKVFIT